MGGASPHQPGPASHSESRLKDGLWSPRSPNRLSTGAQGRPLPMPLAVARRGLALGLALTLVAAGTAFADELKADADVLAGTQTSVDLGQVAPGAERTVNVGFVLFCKGSSHLTAGATLLVDETSREVPVEGDLIVTPGEVAVPADWPASGAFCSGTESAAVVSPAQ